MSDKMIITLLPDGSINVTSVIEASQSYDQAVAAYLAVREEQRKNQVANDAGAMQ